MKQKFLKGKSCLFFGLKNCVNSQKCIDILKSLECVVTPIMSNGRGDTMPAGAKLWKGDFIFSYRNYWRLKKELLNAVNIMAINFHPSTPEFPGSGAYSWALYKSCSEFGVTVHLMNEKFDNGKILDVYKFKIDKNFVLNDLIEKTYKFSLVVFENYLMKLNNMTPDMIKKLKIKDSSFSWNKKVNKISDLDEMRELTFEMDNSEIHKRVRSFHHKNYPLFIKFQDYTFKLSI